MKNKYILIATISILMLGITVLIWNNSQKLPTDNQIKELFSINSGREFISYEVTNSIRYVRFKEKENKRECKVDLIKDYKFGIFNGNWIFGQDWECLH